MIHGETVWRKCAVASRNMRWQREMIRQSGMIRKSGIVRKSGMTAAAALTLCLIWQTPASAAKSPLISGTEIAGEAEGPALEEVISSEKDGGAALSSGEDSDATASYSEEELNDNLVEYGELESLIRRNNSTAVNLENSYQNSLEVYQTAYDSLVSARRDMLNKADELEDEDGDETVIAAYEQNAAIISSSVKQMKRSIDSLNSTSSEASRNRSVWSLVESAQALLCSCKEMEAQVETAQKTVDARQAARDKAASRKAAGLATEEELLQSEKTLLSAQISLQSTQDSAAKLKRQLAAMLGKDAGTMALGEIPAVTQEELAALNLEEDRAKAVIADSGVKSVKRSSATGETEKKLRRQQLLEAEGAASVTADERYQEIAALSLSRDAASASFAAAEKDYGALQIKYSAGLTNKGDYLSGVAEYYQKKAEKEAAEMELRIACDAYQWMLKGV